MAEERPLSCLLDDPLRPEWELELLERPEDELLPDELRPDELLPVDWLPEDRLPGAACFLVVVPFELCPLVRRAVAVCFMAT